jgi:predicted dehydrogenase
LSINRVLIVGSGNIARRHLGILKELLPGAEFALHSRSAISPGNQDPKHLYFTDFKDSLAFAPQLAVVANPSSLHVETAIPLALNGAHLFIEKPLAITAGSTKDLIKAVETSGVKCAVGYNVRYLGSYPKLAGLLNERTIGDIYAIRCEVGQWLPSWRPGRDYRTTVSAQKALGGGGCWN